MQGLTVMVTGSLKRVRADRFGDPGYARAANVSTLEGANYARRGSQANSTRQPPGSRIMQ